MKTVFRQCLTENIKNVFCPFIALFSRRKEGHEYDIKLNKRRK